MFRAKFNVFFPMGTPWSKVVNCLQEVPSVFKVSRVSWSSPSVGYVKLNTNESLQGNPGLSGGGGILWDSNGDVLFVFSKFYGNLSALLVEARALCTGLEICALMGESRVMVEVDSKVLWYILDFKALSPPSIRLIIRKIRLFDSLMHSVTHCFRGGNMVADSLASFTISTGSFVLFHLQHSLPR